jgi:hypothetical protein
VAEFGVDVFGAGDGLGDFFAEEVAVALAEAVEGDAHGGFGEAELGCEIGVRGVGGASGKAGEQRVELFGAGVFGAEAGVDGVEEGEGPGAVEGAVGPEVGAGGGGEGGFGGGGVERGEKVRAAFFGARVVAEVGEVVVKRAEEKGSEASAFAAGGGEGFKAEEAGKKPLHGVVCIREGKSAATRVGEQWRPVKRAEFAEGAVGAFTGGEDEGPAGGGERGVTHRMK